MKRTLILVVVLTLVLSASSAFAQRLPQKEFFIGGAIPLSPDGFKDYFKTGLSVHGQYVIFPMNNVGISFGAAFEFFLFDGDKWLEYYEMDEYIQDASGHVMIVELGVGIRPYLTPATASSQIFLFGMPTFNIISEKETYTDYSDDEYEYTGDDTNFGIALGGGIEMPAGNVNIIIQGVYRSIFSYQPDEEYDADDLSFLGITAGVVF